MPHPNPNPSVTLPELEGSPEPERSLVPGPHPHRNQVVVRTLSDNWPLTLHFRCDTWRGLHLWVNGLTLLSKLARSGILPSPPPPLPPGPAM